MKTKHTKNTTTADLQSNQQNTNRSFISGDGHLEPATSTLNYSLLSISTPVHARSWWSSIRSSRLCEAILRISVPVCLSPAAKANPIALVQTGSQNLNIHASGLIHLGSGFGDGGWIPVQDFTFIRYSDVDLLRWSLFAANWRIWAAELLSFKICTKDRSNKAIRMWKRGQKRYYQGGSSCLCPVKKKE